jgi:hypothetical protein
VYWPPTIEDSKMMNGDNNVNIHPFVLSRVGSLKISRVYV